MWTGRLFLFYSRYVPCSENQYKNDKHIWFHWQHPLSGARLNRLPYRPSTLPSFIISILSLLVKQHLSNKCRFRRHRGNPRRGFPRKKRSAGAFFLPLLRFFTRLRPWGSTPKPRHFLKKVDEDFNLLHIGWTTYGRAWKFHPTFSRFCYSYYFSSRFFTCFTIK